MKIFRNLWAGYPTWFVETGHNGKMKSGIGICKVGDEYDVRFNDTYHASSFKEAPERFPIVGEVSKEELAVFLLSKCKEV